MTANGMQGNREKCLAAGMDEDVPRPVKSTLLKETLEHWLPSDQSEDKAASNVASRERSKPALHSLAGCSACPGSGARDRGIAASHLEPKMHHVTILYDVRLAFEAHFPGIPTTRLTSALDILVVGDDFGSNKAAFDI